MLPQTGCPEEIHSMWHIIVIHESFLFFREGARFLVLHVDLVKNYAANSVVDYWIWKTLKSSRFFMLMCHKLFATENVVKVWLLVQHVEQSQSGEARVVSKVELNPGPIIDKIAWFFLF